MDARGRIERNQLKWLKHVRMPPGHLPGEMFQVVASLRVSWVPPGELVDMAERAEGSLGFPVRDTVPVTQSWTIGRVHGTRYKVLFAFDFRLNYQTITINE